MKKHLYLPFITFCLLTVFGQPDNIQAQCNAPYMMPTATSCTSASLSWTAISGAMNYEYFISTSQATPMMSGTAVSGTSTSASVSGLMPATKYWTFSRTICMSGTSAWGTPISFTTPSCTSSIPAPTFSTTATAHSITMNWTAVSSAVGYEYVVNATSSDPTMAGTPLGLVTTATVTGLMPGTNYYVHMRTNYNGTAGVAHSPWSVAKATSTPSATSVANTTGPGDLFQAYPNPTSGVLTIEIPSDNSTIQVLSVEGKTIGSYSLQKGRQTIDLSNLNVGLYLLRYTDGVATTTTTLSKY